MKILIDAIWLNKPRGLGRYLKEVIYALSKYEGDDLEIILAVPSKTIVSIGHELPSFISIKHFASAPYPIWEQIILPMAIRDVMPDIVFCPNNTAPFFRGGTKFVVTIHDLIFEENLGKGWYQKIGNLYRRLSIQSFKGNPPQIITVSTESSKLIQKRIGVTPIVMYTPIEAAGLMQDPTEKNATNEKIILHIGGISPHKNTERVIAAFKSLNLSNTKLVVLGMGHDNELFKQYSSSNIVFPGWVDDACMGTIFSSASLLVFPSLMEGYGLPIVEGFVTGIPVITSNIPPMDEIAGDAAHLVDPMSIESIANGMEFVLKNSDYAQGLVMAGKKRLEVINSDRLCNQLVDLFKEVYYER